MFKRFWGCHDCGCMTPVVLPDASAAVDTVTAYLEDWYTFFEGHAGHRLTELTAVLGAPVAGLHFGDPMARVTFAVADHDTTYLACGWRESIDAARQYSFGRGTLHLAEAAVEIDDGDVRRALDMEFHPHHLRPAKVEQLLSAVHDTLGDVDTEALEIAFDDAADPEVSVAPMPEAILRRILDASSQIFDPWELARVEKFLVANRAEDGLLALRVRRRPLAIPPERPITNLLRPGANAPR